MKRLGWWVAADFQLADLAGVTVFELASLEAGHPAYAINLVSEHGGPIRSSAGISVATDARADVAFDTLIVTGDPAISTASAGLLKFVTAAADQSRRIAGIGTGVFGLAAAGILDGRRATTHWANARELQRRYPKIKVDADRIVIAAENIWTAAGLGASIDLSLALVEADLGFEVSKRIADRMVVHHRRTAGQSQFAPLRPLESPSDRVQRALDHAKRNLTRALSVAELAEVANLSLRQFSRAFRAATGESPAKVIESLRLEAAKALVEASRQSIDSIARETGFADPERMRRAFIRKFGHPPQTFRRVAGSLPLP